MHTQFLVVSDYLWPPWTVAQQAALSMGFSRQEYWSGLPFPAPGDFPNLGIEPAKAMSLLYWQVGSLPLSHLGSPRGCVGFSNCGLEAIVEVHQLSLFCSLWNLPQSGVESMAPALADGFSSTELPGSPRNIIIFITPRLHPSTC